MLFFSPLLLLLHVLLCFFFVPSFLSFLIVFGRRLLLERIRENKESRELLITIEFEAEREDPWRSAS